jgi:hypothetical protein
VVDGLRARRAESAYGFEVEGRDPDGDVAGFRLELFIDGVEGPWLVQERPLSEVLHHPQGVVEGVVEAGPDGVFRARWSSAQDLPPIVRMRVTLVDAAGLESAPAEAAVEPPDPVEAGDACDEAGAVFACPEGMLCDRRDGDDAHRCQAPVAGCPPDWDVRALGDAPVEGDDTGAPDLTAPSCEKHWWGGGGAADHVYRYRATRDGTHRFVAESPPYHVVVVSVRRYCTFPRPEGSELGCALDADQERASTAVEADLRAGETVYVFVHHLGTDRGPYRLSVD